jgi:hypothetical protein
MVSTDLRAAECVVPVAPLREAASHRSEMVSQLVFGEPCRIMEEEKDGWQRVTCDYDGYEGWCQKGQLSAAPDLREKIYYLNNWTSQIDFRGSSMRIPFGSYCDAQNPDAWDPLQHSVNEAELLSVAYNFLNTPYLWGGRSVFGIDCSGFVQTVFRFFDIRLLRDASLQATQGEAIGFLQEARCGDLAFFDNAEGRITHVGLLLNEKEILHSSVKVRVDDIDNYGIVNRETGERTHKLRLIKRYF